MQGFKPTNNDQPKREPEPFDVEMAGMLYNVLKKHNMLEKQYASITTSKWPDEFRLLRKHFTDNEIRATVKWYVQHILDEYTPRVRSAHKFRQKYDQISEAIRRAGFTVNIEEVVVTPLAKAIAKEVDLQWPMREKLVELQFIQVSLDNYTTFLRALRRLHKEEEAIAYSKRIGTTRRSCDWTEVHILNWLNGVLAGNADFVAAHARDINALAWSWTDHLHTGRWTGNLMRWVFTADAERFQIQMFRHTADYMGSGEAWHGLWQKVQKGMTHHAGGKTGRGSGTEDTNSDDRG